MQVKSVAECSAILLTFIKLPFVIKIFNLSILSGRLKQVLLYPVYKVFFFKSELQEENLARQLLLNRGIQDSISHGIFNRTKQLTERLS